MWSSEVKQGLLKHHDMVLVDAMGSTEGGMGSSRASRDNPAETAKFVLNPGVIVITDDGEIVEPIRQNGQNWNKWIGPSRIFQRRKEICRNI